MKFFNLLRGKNRRKSLTSSGQLLPCVQRITDQEEVLLEELLRASHPLWHSVQEEARKIPG